MKDEHAESQKLSQTASLDYRWIKSKTKSELVSLLVDISTELKSRMVHDSRTGTTVPLEPPAFPAIDPGTIQEFQRLPSGKSTEAGRKIVLVSSEPGTPPLGLEICGDVIIGRLAENIKIDLDLTPYDGPDLGVSREHAIIRPGKDGLLLFDLGSANGTYCNGVRAKLGHNIKIFDGDVITFGGLHLKVTYVEQP